MSALFVGTKNHRQEGDALPSNYAQQPSDVVARRAQHRVQPVTGFTLEVTAVHAMIHRLKTGEGHRIETSLLQAAMQTYWLAANCFSTGRDTPPLGTAHSLISPYQVFQARDSGLVIGGGNPNAWRRICEVLEHPEWQEDARFNHPQLRVKHRVELTCLIEGVLANGTDC